MDPADDAAASFAAVEAALTARWPESRIDPTLDRIAHLLDLLGSPHRAVPAIAVAGTNGKSSTARMIDSMLRGFGLRTGLTTSPHLSSVTERIVIDGDPIDADRFVVVHDDIADYLAWADGQSAAAGGPPLSYFETVTAMAFAAFADAPVEVAVLEVGMGGRWDATNVADASVAVVTPISVDHADYLGSEPPAIAREKAGVIKPGSIAVLAQQSPAVLDVLLRQCDDVAATPVRWGTDYDVLNRRVAVGGQTISVRGMAGEYPDLFLPLHGAHQAGNAAAAIVAVEAFLGGGESPLNPDTLALGLATTTSPGRLEVVHRQPTVLVDAAHNPAGAAALARAVTEEFSFTRVIGVVGVLADKDADGILTALADCLDQVIVTTAPSPRALPAEDLADIARRVFGPDRVEVVPRLPAALDAAVDAAGDSAGVLVTGSVTVAAQARLLLGAQAESD